MTIHPSLSVIIPTHNRPELLSRAICSARESFIDESLEVIVVPNGQGQEWKAIAKEFSSDHRVKWHPIAIANVGAARNHGIAMASGSFIRFLDDDDYFYPEKCRDQYRAFIDKSADICSGSINVVKRNGDGIKILTQPNTHDFYVSVACPSRCVQVGAHIFRKSLINNIKWSESRNVGEDVDWLLRVASSQEITWARMDECVATWVQHDEFRLSKGHDPGGDTLRYLANSLLDSALSLERRGLIDSTRRIAIADGLWSFFQKGFRYDREYWRSVAQEAEKYHPNRKPPSAIYRMPGARRISPIAIETLIAPVRTAYHPLRLFLEKMGINRV